MMKLHFIYIFIGISTLILNLILTLHIIRKHKNESCQRNWDYEQVITFRLSGKESIEGITTAAAACDDTVPLE